MGIRRTPSGRIYFDGDTESEKDRVVGFERDLADSGESLWPEDSGADSFDDQDEDEDNADDSLPRPDPLPLRRPITGNVPLPSRIGTEVVSLLGQVSDRLKRSEEEREELWKELQDYRKTLSDIEDRAARSETACLGLQNKLGRYEKLETDLLRRQEALEKAQKEQIRSMARSGASQTDVSGRVRTVEDVTSRLEQKFDEAIALQKRLDRRLEKTIQDRARLIRKIDRLEDSMLETQDTLRARALVLLTDQTLAAQGRLPHLPALGGESPALSAPTSDSIPSSGETLATDPPASTPTWWHKWDPSRAVSTAAVLVAAFVGGWILSEYTRPPLPDIQPPAAVQKTADARTLPAPTQTQTPQISGDPVLDLLDFGSGPEMLRAFEDDSESFAQRLNALDIGSPQTIESGDFNVPANTDTDINTDTDAGSLPVSSPSPAPEEPPVTIAEQRTPAPAAPTPDTSVNHRGASASPQIRTTTTQTTGSADPDLPAHLRDIETRALQGSAEAQHDLAAIYTAGHGGVDQNYPRAGFWFRKSAEGGVSNAAYNLGVLYHQGLGVDRDLEEALIWYAKAATQGHPEAQYNLGIAHIEGIGVPYDPAKAVSYFESAAAEGIPEAAYNLGLIHENGLLGAARPDEALLWYKTAADWGSAEGRTALEQLSHTLGVDPDAVSRLIDKMRESGEVSPPPERTGQAGASMPGMDLDPATPRRPAEQVTTLHIQKHLMAMGLYPGPADGLGSPLTEDAIRAYESRFGLPVRGNATEDILVHMLAQQGLAEEEFGSRER